MDSIQWVELDDGGGDGKWVAFRDCELNMFFLLGFAFASSTIGQDLTKQCTQWIGSPVTVNGLLESRFTVTKTNQQFPSKNQLFAAIDGETGKKVVIKKQALTQETMAEICIHSFATTLPHVAKLLGVYKKQGDLYMIMPTYQTDAFEYFKQEENRAQINLFATQMSQTLGKLAQQGILHFDFKPENVLVNNQGDFFLTDFGFAEVARLIADEESPLIKGTRRYMAPEICGPLKNVNERLDVFAFGVALYKIATDHFPFDYPASAAICHYVWKLKSSSVVYPSTLPPMLADLLKHTLQTNANKRFSWRQVLSHPFLTGSSVMPDECKQIECQNNHALKPQKNSNGPCISC